MALLTFFDHFSTLPADTGYAVGLCII